MSLRTLVCLVGGVAGIGFLAAAEVAAPVLPPEDPLVAAVAQSTNRFAADLYARLRTAEGNLCVSPLGLAQALLPVAVGAQDRTAGELTAALQLSLSPTEAADGFALLTRRLQRTAGGEARLDFAKALWVQQWNTINTDYVELLRQHCRSELRVTDFTRGEFAAHWINRWVSDHTGDRIAARAEAGTLDATTSLFVANAVCFAQEWKEPFDPALTAPEPFRLAVPAAPTESVVPPAPATPTAAPGGEDGAVAADESAPSEASVVQPPVAPAVVEVPTMRRAGVLRLATQAGCRLVQLPYRGESLSMVVLLPDEGVALEDLESTLTGERLDTILRAVAVAEPERVEIRLPRFAVQQVAPRLGDALRGMGVALAFDRSGAADFTTLGVNLDDTPVYLSAVQHVVKLSVEEVGVEAAAVSAPTPGMPYDAPVSAPVAFRVDRPFLYFICDNRTDALLFMGRVLDPRLR